MNKQNLVIGILVLLLLVISTILTINWYNDKLITTYNEGYAEGQTYVVNSISTTANIPYYVTNADNTTQLKITPLAELCEGLKGE